MPVSGWWARKALEMPIGNSKVQGTTCCPGDHLRKICRRSAACAARREILPIGTVSVVVSSQPRSDGVPERCKFASLRLLPEIRPWAEFVGVATDQQICVTVCRCAAARVDAQNCASLCRWPTDKSANWRICGHGQLRTVAHQKRRKSAQLSGGLGVGVVLSQNGTIISP